MTAASQAALLDVTGKTRLYLVVGDPIEQVLSTRLYNSMMAERGVDVLFAPYRFAAENFDAAVAGLRAVCNIDGIIPTIPHKGSMLTRVDGATDRARAVGAVNAIRIGADGAWFGDILDGVGYANGLTRNGVDPAGQRFLVLGAGGAGAAICHELAARRSSGIRVYDPAGGKAQALALSVSDTFPGFDIQAGAPEVRDASIIVNASPTGMTAGDPMPTSLDGLTPAHVITDMIMQPATTPFLEAALTLGCRVVRGHEALLGQAEANMTFFGLDRNTS